jgi:hypothetical protein
MRHGPLSALPIITPPALFNEGLIPFASIVMLPVHFESLSEVVVAGVMMYHHTPTYSRGGREMSEILLFVRISRC